MANDGRLFNDSRKWLRIHLTTGCIPHSAGCDHCTGRRQHRARHRYKDPRFPRRFNDGVSQNWEELTKILNHKGKLCFVSPYSDLFLADEGFLDAAPDYFMDNPENLFVIETKRAHWMAKWAHRQQERGRLPRNVVLATSVEDEDALWRIDELRSAPAEYRAVFFRPLLGAVAPDLSLIDWAVVSGENGLRARPMEPAWAAGIAAAADKSRTAFYFDGLGARLMENYFGKEGGKTRTESGIADLDMIINNHPRIVAEMPFIARRELPRRLLDWAANSSAKAATVKEG